MSQNMDSILQQINQNNGNKSREELLQTFSYLVDEELNRLYQKTDCVDNYNKNFIRFRQNSRQFYQCVHNSCQFSTNKSSLIVRHIRRHLKQKPYLCPISVCTNQFYQKCDLRSHLLRHFDDRPFICNQKNCDKSYTTRKALSLHIKTHSPFGFECQECHQMFATNWKLNKHLKIKHKLSGQSVTNGSTIGLKSEAKSVNNMDLVCRSKTKLKTKTIIKTEDKQNTNQLIDSINWVNEQIGDQLTAKYKTFSAKFGFEEVLKYLTNDCHQSSAEQMTTEDNVNEDNVNEDNVIEDNITNGNTTFADKTEMASVEPMDTRMDFNWGSETLTNSNTDSFSQTSDNLFKNYIENICSLIEIYTLNSNDVKTKVLFKCFQCMYTSNSIDPIVGHVLVHISDGLKESLQNKSRNNFI